MCIFNKNRIINFFIVATIISIFLSVLYSIFIDDPSYFLIGAMDSDPGGDFYLSICFSNKLQPYTSGSFPYPPLSVLFCYFIKFFLHENFNMLTHNMDYVTANTNIFTKIFAFKNANLLLAIISVSLLSLTIVNFLIKKRKLSINYSYVLSMCLLANAGFLCALDRGNLLIGALLFTTTFVLFYNDNNDIIRKISLLSLALAFNFKPYTAIFGFLLLYDKRYKDAIKVSIIALIMFILPFFILDGSVINNIKLFFQSLFSFGGRAYSMIGFKSFINLGLKCLGKILDIKLSLDKSAMFLSLIFSTILLIYSFLNIKKWQRIMILTLIMMMASTNYGYILAFLLIPMLYFLCEEREFNISNIIYFVSFLFLMLPIRGIRGHVILDNVLLVFLSIFVIFDNYIIKKELDRGVIK